MNRRDALLTTGSMIVSASLGAIACGGNKAVAQNAPKAPPSPVPPPLSTAPHHAGGDAAVIEAAEACIAKGDACIAHCLQMAANGDASMGACGKRAYEMRAVMPGVIAAAHGGSKHFAALAKIAAEFCRDCESECRKHAGMSPVCKDCADACARMVAACQKLGA